ncbi:MAG: cation:proton antiporter [Halofilum sp. (in: g-proteobacteria)]
MPTALWFLLVGALLLAIGLTAGVVRRLPVTTAIVYLTAGVLVGPSVLDLFHFNPLEQSELLALITEVAVLLSLFTAGMKMPVPFRAVRWRAPVLLAFAAMAVTATLMTAFGWYVLGLPIGAAVLLAGILAPTDPVLATEVQTRHPGDRDRLRFSLTCEAGMNDGSAFPVVMLGLGLLGLHGIGAGGWRWFAVDLVWATAAGIALGIVAGCMLAHGIAMLRRRGRDAGLMHDFIALGFIGMVYGLGVLIDAWGFLAVFFAAVALRATENRLINRARDPLGSLQPAEVADTPRVTDNSLGFNEQLERLSEVVLVLLLGGSLFLDSWSWRAVATALFLFLAARPLAVLVTLPIRHMPLRLRTLTSWFGVRGIGSLYYLMYAIQQGLDEDLALELLHITLIVVTLSIVFHGISVKPLLTRWGPGQYRRTPGAGNDDGVAGGGGELGGEPVRG